ncbi:Flp pilus assembly protein CpaB [Bradyrhizobium sp. OAE829]|uniref:Flp pilus assembly protein CpaB n=1 Tax=Bradyrhizobium sp. OAE829 TaxID=2663807 RepID=UPI00178A3BCD
MSSALRLSIIAVLLLATAALGLIALNMNSPKQAVVAEVVHQAPAPAKTVGYYAAARPLPRGTLARDEDFVVRQVQPERVPADAILETADSKASLSGSLVRKFVEAGSPITQQDIVRPQDRGFLASVLAPDTRAISIKVDEESGVSGLIRPGDHVDVLLTQMFEKADPGRRALSETVLRNVRIIAIDQEIVQGSRGVAAASAKQAATVSLELWPDQVQRITVAKQLGKLSLSVRAAVMDKRDSGDARAMSSCDVSPELARQNAAAGQTTAIVVYSGGEAKQFSVKKSVADSGMNCDASDLARLTAAAGNAPEKR